MSKIRFSKEDIEKLKDNPYILNISEKAITYTDEFKEKFLELYNKGKMPTEIFRLCEIYPEIIGRKRIEMVAYRLKKKVEYGEDVTDKRKEFSGKPKSKELTKDEEIQRLKHKIQYQEQRIEFLKKFPLWRKKPNGHHPRKI